MGVGWPEWTRRAQEGSPRPGGPLRTEHDVVMTFSWETLHDARARGMARPPDRLAESLGTAPSVRRLIVSDAPRPVWSRSRWRDGEEAPHRLCTHFRPLTWRSSPPTTVAGARAWAKVMDTQLARASRRRRLRDPVLITFNPLLAGLTDLAWASRVVYYARDDWAAYPPHRRSWPVYRAAYAGMRARGRKVAAVSEAILDRIGTGGVVVANGIDPREWLPAPAGPSADPLGGPLIAYVGSLDQRLDVGLVGAIATAFPLARVVLAGPILEPSALASLSSLPNVELTGSLGRKDVTDLLREASVGLVPHRDSPLTRGMSPLKLYEYLAAGCPVVAVDLPPMRGISQYVSLCRHVDQHIDAIARAVQGGRIPEDRRQLFVQENAWASRHDQLLAWATSPGSTS